MNVEQMRELVESLETMHGLMVKMAEQGIKGYELLAKELNHDYTDLSEDCATAASMYQQVHKILTVREKPEIGDPSFFECEELDHVVAEPS